MFGLLVDGSWLLSISLLDFLLCVGVDAREVEFEAIYWDAAIKGAPPRYSVQGVARFNRWFRECLIVYVLIRKPETEAESMALDSRRAGLKRKATQTQSDAAASSKRLWCGYLRHDHSDGLFWAQLAH